MSDDTTPIYFRVSPAIWRARTWTDDMRLLACYLLTSPHRTLEGLFILPKGYICADLRWSAERLVEPFARLLTDGFIAYDETAEVCLIRKALKYQRPENPNMDKAAIRRLVTVPASSLDGLFHASAQQYAPRLAERLAERLPERFGKSQLCSSSTQLNPALSAPAREEPVDSVAGKSGGESEIPLNKGRTALVDSDDVEMLSTHSWYAVQSGERTYAATKVKSEVLLMHRAVTGLGIDHDGLDVHHKNGNGLDNRKGNLEVLNRTDHLRRHRSEGGEPVEDPPEPSDAVDTCDGQSCAIREFPASAFGPLRRAIARSKHPEQWREVGTNGPFDALLAEYSGHLCAACQAGLGEYERPQLDGLCEQALVASLEGLKGAEDVAAVLRSRLHRYGLAELVGDRTFEELRRAKRDKRRRGSTKAIGECLPPKFAQPQGAAKSCEPASVAG